MTTGSETPETGPLSGPDPVPVATGSPPPSHAETAAAVPEREELPVVMADPVPVPEIVPPPPAHALAAMAAVRGETLGEESS